MRSQFIILLFTIFFLFSCTNKTTLHEKFPDKLLSDDHGILRKEDLIDKRDVLPLGALGIDSNPASRWHCFESINLKSKCIKSDQKVEELNDYAADFEMSIVENGKKYDYNFRGLISFERCEEHRSTWKKLMEGEKYFCVSGALLKIDSKDKNRIFGFFDRLKTNKGCDSWFNGDCK